MTFADDDGTHRSQASILRPMILAMMSALGLHAAIVKILDMTSNGMPSTMTALIKVGYRPPRIYTRRL